MDLQRPCQLGCDISRNTLSDGPRPVSRADGDALRSDETARVVATLGRLVTLGANLAEAETSEEFQAVLYAAADPVGSFATKRQPGTQLTVGAYVGGVVGTERKLVDDGDWRGHFGLTLPIGLEWSAGLKTDAGSPLRSIGLFVAPVDLGGIASYRITDFSGDEGSLEYPEVGWRQLLAPSVYIVFGISDALPLAIGAGIQYAPWARAIGEGDEEKPVDAFRVSLLVAVDVTLFRL